MAQAPQHPDRPTQPATPQGGMVVPTEQGPKSGMKHDQPVHLTELTEAEQKVGREASQKVKERMEQEQAMGKHVVQRSGGSTPPKAPPKQEHAPPAQTPKPNPLHGG